MTHTPIIKKAEITLICYYQIDHTRKINTPPHNNFFKLTYNKFNLLLNQLFKLLRAHKKYKKHK